MPGGSPASTVASQPSGLRRKNDAPHHVLGSLIVSRPGRLLRLLTLESKGANRTRDRRGCSVFGPERGEFGTANDTPVSTFVHVTRGSCRQPAVRFSLFDYSGLSALRSVRPPEFGGATERNGPEPLKPALASDRRRSARVPNGKHRVAFAGGGPATHVPKYCMAI